MIWNRQAETLPRKELEALQLERLKAVLERVYAKVPFYKKHFDQVKINLSTFKSLDDLQCLPFTKKTDLRDNYPFGLFAEPLDKVRRIHASSGTKGKPTVVGYTDSDLEDWREVCARSLAAAGARPADVLHNAYGYGLFTGGLGMHYGAENFGATVVPASGGRTQQQIMLLQDFGARILCSTPSYALNMAYMMDDLKIDRESIKLEIGIFGAEPWTEELRLQIEKALSITALDIYGLSEVMGPGVSMECIEGRNGLHIWEDYFLAEIVDPETGRKLPYGEEGELVFTTLTKEAFPVIRYRTGDISRLYNEVCCCGRTMVRMERIKARLDDMLIIRGVNLFPSEIEKVLLSLDELTPHYQLVIDRVRALDVLEVHVEITELLLQGWGSFDHSNHETLTNKVQNQLKDSLGLTADVKLMQPRSVPRSEGKAVRVVDRRNPDNTEK
ncbi:MAG: phenylacetate--CoA ligase [Candidatus Melainabacteria bacterium]|nr:phenylacetate--CoA ligase [Candidatus Melainabacteria bacterium]